MMGRAPNIQAKRTYVISWCSRIQTIARSAVSQLQVAQVYRTFRYSGHKKRHRTTLRATMLHGQEIVLTCQCRYRILIIQQRSEFASIGATSLKYVQLGLTCKNRFSRKAPAFLIKIYSFGLGRRNRSI